MKIFDEMNGSREVEMNETCHIQMNKSICVCCGVQNQFVIKAFDEMNGSRHVDMNESCQIEIHESICDSSVCVVECRARS